MYKFIVNYPGTEKDSFEVYADFLHVKEGVPCLYIRTGSSGMPSDTEMVFAGTDCNILRVE